MLDQTSGEEMEVLGAEGGLVPAITHLRPPYSPCVSSQARTPAPPPQAHRLELVKLALKDMGRFARFQLPVWCYSRCSVGAVGQEESETETQKGQ